MYQMFYTSCQAGRRLNGQSGFQTRAVTPGLSPALQSQVERYTAYELPQGMDPSSDVVALAPPRFSYLNDPEVGPFALHTVYVGRDGAGSRQGNSFSHLLLDLTDTDPEQIIQGWKSDDWRTVDGDFSVDLPLANRLPNAQKVSDIQLQAFLQRKEHQQLLAFVLAAHLLAGADDQIIVTAPAETVAMCVYGVCRALPIGLRKPLTFSTYEYAAASSYCRLVGTWNLTEQPSHDEPWFRPGKFGIDVRDGFHSSLDANPSSKLASEFADFVVQQQQDGQSKQVDGFRAECESARVSSAQDLLLRFRLSQGHELSDIEAQQIIGIPEMAEQFFEHAPFRRSLWMIVSQANDAGDDASKSVPNELLELTSKRAHRGLWSQSAIHLIVEHLTAGRFQAATKLVNQLPSGGISDPEEIVLAVAKQTIQLLDTSTGTDQTGFELRMWMLKWFARITKQSDHLTAERMKWSLVPEADLANLIDSDLPKEMINDALSAFIRVTAKYQLSKSVQATLQQRSDLIPILLTRLQSAKSPEIMAELFELWVARQSFQQMMAFLVDGHSSIPSELLASWLIDELAKTQTDAKSAAKKHGSALATAIGRMGDECLDVFCGRLLKDLNMSDFGSDQLIAFLKKSQARVQSERQSLEAVVRTIKFCLEPTLALADHKSLAGSVGGLPDVLHRDLLKQIPRLFVKAILEAPANVNVPEALTESSQVWEAKLSSAIKPDVLAKLKADAAVWSRPNAVACLVLDSMSPDQKPEKLSQLGKLITSKSPRNVRFAVDTLSKAWDKDQKKRWAKECVQVRPIPWSTRVFWAVGKFLNIVGTLVCWLFSKRLWKFLWSRRVRNTIFVFVVLFALYQWSPLGDFVDWLIINKTSGA